MNDNVLTKDCGILADAMQSVRRSLKMANMLANSYVPPIGGERYLTDKDLTRAGAPCSSTATRGYCPISCSAARRSTARATSRRCWSVTTVRRTDAFGRKNIGRRTPHAGCRLPMLFWNEPVPFSRTPHTDCAGTRPSALSWNVSPSGRATCGTAPPAPCQTGTTGL